MSPSVPGSGTGRGAAPATPGRGNPLTWIRQTLACGVLFLLSSRLPGDLVALAVEPRLSGPDGSELVSDLARLFADGFGLLCALYLSHSRLRGVQLWRCYPPQRLIPLSLHFLGLLWGLVSLPPLRGLPGG